MALPDKFRAVMLAVCGLATAALLMTGQALALNDNGTPCSADAECNSGSCVAGICCAEACTPPPHMAASGCSEGITCSFACVAGWGDCDGSSANGCETDLSTAQNCGGCGEAALPANNSFICSTNHLTSVACVAATCVGTCTAGWGDCNSNKAITGGGCESDLNVAAARTGGGPTASYFIPGYPEGITNCGTCGDSCDDGNGCTTDLCVQGSTIGVCQHFNRNTCATARCNGGGYSQGDGESGIVNQAACESSDSDNDGIPDGWEQSSTNPYTGAQNSRGIDINCDGVIGSNDFTYPPGEEPSASTKDVYLRIRAMGRRPGTGAVCSVDADCVDSSRPYCDPTTGACSEEPSTGHQLSVGVVQRLRDAFLAHGVTLHVDYDPSDLILHADSLQFSPTESCPSGSVYFYDVKAFPHWDAKLQYVYHFAVIAHDWCAQPGASGVSEILGNDGAATLGTTPFTLSGEDRVGVEAGTLMHQLGHNLGLTHLLPERGPNFLSVMNYRYQFTGIYRAEFPFLDPPMADTATRRFSFSSYDMDNLNEEHLNENTILQPGSLDVVTFSCPSGSLRRGLAGGRINWNCNGTTGGGASDSDTAVNVDGVRPIFFDIHTGRNDVLSLAYGFQCQPTFENGAALAPFFVANNELTIQDAIAHHELLPMLDVEIDVRNGCTANWIFLGNKGPAPIALLGTATFDVNKVVLASLDFAGAKPVSAAVVYDVNADGIADLNVLFRQSDMNLTTSSQVGTLTGTLTNGQAFQGSDSVIVSSSPQPKRGGDCPVR